MAIYRKTSVSKDLSEFKKRSNKLLDLLKGSEPNPNIYDKYSDDPKHYNDEFIEINMEELEYALSDFETSIKILKKLKTKKAKQQHSSK